MMTMLGLVALMMMMAGMALDQALPVAVENQASLVEVALALEVAQEAVVVVERVERLLDLEVLIPMMSPTGGKLHHFDLYLVLCVTVDYLLYCFFISFVPSISHFGLSYIILFKLQSPC